MANTKKAILIGNDREMSDPIKLVLHRRRIEIVETATGREGLETMRRVKPDLVLLDLILPDMDGWGLYQQIKTDPELKDTPVIVITGKAQGIDDILGLHIL